ncbi:hypothetical protein C1H46_044114 [Malus baccata]|uniref:Uncharacterized protein n=1 Tax=Malus baccata TaxID=106549 RepID=A0A540K8V2_MALBA|nr:hypothetical protein C1H46_044114 [Malus baccata]
MQSNRVEEDVDTEPLLGFRVSRKGGPSYIVSCLMEVLLYADPGNHMTVAVDANRAVMDQSF